MGMPRAPNGPAQAPTLQACGGEPFGLWQATGVELGPAFEVVDPPYFPAIGGGDCAMLPAQVAAPNFLLYLASGGVASFAFGNWSFEYQWPSKCSNGNTSDCIWPLSGDPSCTCHDNGCGVSSCTVQIGSTWGGTTHGGATWTRAGSTIAIQNVTTFEYCVEGDTMRITWGHALFTMKHVQAGGVPTPCTARSPDTCTAGLGCHPTCSGGANCSDAQSEDQCTNRQGCVWDPTHCAGTTAAGCELQDYGVVPGCEILSTDSKCVGTAGSCAAKTHLDCGRTPGCTWGPGCVGGALTCGDAFDCTGCNAAPGCACNQDGSCLGSSSFDCTMFDHVETCQAWGSNLDLCNWAQQTCNGKPTQCSELSLFDCANTAGCQIQGS